MKKVFLIIILLLIFLIINFLTGFLVFIDVLKDLRTIKVESQGELIVQDIKEHFDIDYNITKVTFQSGFPDGYFLMIYDENNNMKEVFEDEHEGSEIYHYFDDVKSDIPEHLKYLIIELIVEFIIIRALIKRKSNYK